MRSRFSKTPENTDVFVAQSAAVVLASASVTASQTLGAALDALLRAGATTAKDAARATGINDATISKFRTGLRWPKAKHWDALSSFFGVPAYVLLRPEEAVIRQPLVGADRDSDRGDTLIAHGTLPSNRDVVTSALPLGRSAMHHDPELLAAFLTYWDAVSSEQRLELVGYGHRLRTEAHSSTPVKTRA